MMLVFCNTKISVFFLINFITILPDFKVKQYFERSANKGFSM